MCVRLFFVLVIITEGVFSAGIGESCVTPNNESAKCVPVSTCSVIYHAYPTTNSSVAKFLKQSQCGYDKQVLVCCGSSAYFSPITTERIDALVTKTTIDPIDVIVRKAPRVAERNPEIVQHENITLGSFESRELPDRTICGLEKDEVERIIGGELTDLGEFPWMAALEYKDISTGENVGVKCGGSIINKRYVSTAAHCILNEEIQLTSVRLGEWKLNSNPDCKTFVANIECADKVKKIDIEKSIPHPYYGTKPRNNDIGLLRLAEDIEFTDYIRPVCLPPPNLPNPQLGTNMTVSGWGLTENNTPSDYKLKVAVPILSNTDCNKNLERAITPNQLCAGGELGKDACRGDSGGPIMRLFQDALSTKPQWYLEGVVSTGLGCGRTGVPAVYTRISRYVGWIISTISEND